MRTWTMCVVGAGAALALAGSVVLVARPAQSATPKPPAILLWNRAFVWQSDTTLPDTDLGEVHFSQTGSDVTGTFPGGSLTGIANGLKLSGLITLPGDLGT